MLTPWGQSDYEQQAEAPGVTFYGTPSHGGFHVDDDAAGFIPAAIQARSFAGHPWYEEDCDWAVVVWYCPGFKPEQRRRAYEVLTASETWRDLTAANPPVEPFDPDMLNDDDDPALILGA